VAAGLLDVNTRRGIAPAALAQARDDGLLGWTLGRCAVPQALSVGTGCTLLPRALAAGIFTGL
jgi:hypothetical protein